MLRYAAELSPNACFPDCYTHERRPDGRPFCKSELNPYHSIRWMRSPASRIRGALHGEGHAEEVLPGGG